MDEVRSGRCQEGWYGVSFQFVADNRNPKLFSQLNSYICECELSPKCRHDHRLKQHPKWTVEQLPDGTFRWTTPAGRSYDTEPTRYPI